MEFELPRDEEYFADLQRRVLAEVEVTLRERVEAAGYAWEEGTVSIGFLPAVDLSAANEMKLIAEWRPSARFLETVTIGAQHG